MNLIPSQRSNIKLVDIIQPFIFIILLIFIVSCVPNDTSEPTGTSFTSKNTALTQMAGISQTSTDTLTPSLLYQTKTPYEGGSESVFELQSSENSYSIDEIANFSAFKSGEYFIFQESLGPVDQERNTFYYIAADLSWHGTLFTIGGYGDRNAFPSVVKENNKIFVCMHDLLIMDIPSASTIAYSLYIHGEEAYFAGCQHLYSGKEDDQIVHIDYLYREQEKDENTWVIVNYSIPEEKIVSSLLIPSGYSFSLLNSEEFLLIKDILLGVRQNPEYCFGDLIRNVSNCLTHKIPFRLAAISGNKNWAVVELPEDLIGKYIQEKLPERSFGEFLVPFQCLSDADLSFSDECKIIPILAPAQLYGWPGILYIDNIENSDTFIILHSITLGEFTARIWSWNKSNNAVTHIITLPNSSFSYYSVDCIWDPVEKGFFFSYDADELPIRFISMDGTRKTFPGKGAFVAGTITF